METYYSPYKPASVPLLTKASACQVMTQFRSYIYIGPAFEILTLYDRRLWDSIGAERRHIRIDSLRQSIYESVYWGSWS